MGLNPGELVAKESLIFSEFEKMNLLDDLKINKVEKGKEEIVIRI